jgi:hypothetical protein
MFMKEVPHIHISNNDSAVRNLCYDFATAIRA